MSKDLFIHAAEVAEALGISRPYAYKLVRELNKELEEKEMCIRDSSPCTTTAGFLLADLWS